MSRRAGVSALALVALAALAALSGCGKESAGTDRGSPATVAEGGTGGSTILRVRKDHSERATAADDFVIKLERGLCYGVCPEYSVIVRADGTVEYDGKTYVSVKGHETKHLSSEEVTALANRFEKAGFAGLDWEDPCPRLSTDSPTVTLTFVQGGRKRVLADYHGNGCVPHVVRELEDAVDTATGIKAWITCDGSYCGR